MGFSRQEYYSGLPFPSPGDLLNLGIEAVSLESPAWAGGFFTAEPPGVACLQLSPAPQTGGKTLVVPGAPVRSQSTIQPHLGWW